MPLPNDAPATVGMIRKIRREMAELRTDIFKEIHEVDDKQSNLTDELMELALRNRRAITRLKKELEDA
jgi:uncharacterized protein YaaR (DUF327 family)